MNEVTPNPEVKEEGTEVVDTPSEEPTDTAGTEQKETVETEQPEHEVETVDYREKFVQSAKGAQKLYEENKELKSKLAENQQPVTQDLPTTHSPETDANLYPGFEELTPEAQKELVAYTNSVTQRVKEDVNSDPAIAYAKKSYNENKWETAFAGLSTKFPDLLDTKEEFKAKYFDPNNVPDNIEDILDHMAKAHLFDKAREIGAEEGKEVAERVQLETPTGGDKTPTAHRSLADWQRMAQENPAEFAKLHEQYKADVESGKLKE